MYYNFNLHPCQCVYPKKGAYKFILQHCDQDIFIGTHTHTITELLPNYKFNYAGQVVIILVESTERLELMFNYAGQVVFILVESTER